MHSFVPGAETRNQHTPEQATKLTHGLAVDGPCAAPPSFVSAALAIAALFVGAAAYLAWARRRGLYAHHRVWTVFAVEIAQVAAIVLPAALGGAAPALMAAALAVPCTVEWHRALQRAWPQRGWPWLAAPYPAAGLAAYAWIAGQPQGLAWVLLVYGLVEVHDAAAWLVGGACGRTPLAPRLSPRKTWEGLVGGLIAAGLYGLGCAHWLPGARPNFALGTAVCCAGLAGDLIASWVKRRAKQKDFSGRVVTQGGVLDLYDALLLAAPVAALWRLAVI